MALPPSVIPVVRSQGTGAATADRAAEVDIARLVSFAGVFEPLLDPQVFASVQVSSDLGTIVWPTGADIDPLVLYDTLCRTRVVNETRRG